MRPFVGTACLLLILSNAAPGQAEPAVVRQHDGTGGTLSPLGENTSIYPDAHGTVGITHQGSGVPSHSFSSPHGATPGSVTPFGTPVPPNHLTPAPVLPLSPRGMGQPQPQLPRATPGLPGSFSGRGGR